MKGLGAAMAAGAMLVACDGGGTDERAKAPAPAAVVVSNPYHDNLVELTELGRGAVLRRAIRTARESCNRVESAAFQQDHDNLKMWTATCQSRSYAVFLAPNGDVQVRNCADMATLKLPACRLEKAA